MLPNGDLSYDPSNAFDSLRPDQTGQDTFTYTVTDGDKESQAVTVTIDVAGVNDIARVNPDWGLVALQDVATRFSTAALLANDVDPDGIDPLRIESIRSTRIDYTNDAYFTYDTNGEFSKAAPGRIGGDASIYSVQDDLGAETFAILQVNVMGIGPDIAALFGGAIVEAPDFVTNTKGAIVTTGLVDGELRVRTTYDALDVYNYEYFVQIYGLQGTLVQTVHTYGLQNSRVLVTDCENGMRTRQVETQADGDILTTTIGPDGKRDSFVFEDISDSRDWQSYTNTYNDAGQVVSQRFVNDDRSIWYVETSYENGVPSERVETQADSDIVTTTYGLDGVRSERVETQADGDIVTTTYGLDGVRDSVVFQDISDSRDWQSYTRTFNDEGGVLSTDDIWDFA